MIKYINELNNLFKDIEQLHNETKIINTRNKKLLLRDILIFAFIGSKKETAKKAAIKYVNELLKSKPLKNNNKSNKVDNSCFQRKLNNVSVDFFKNLYYKIKNKINEIIDDDKNLQNISNILTNNLVNFCDNDNNKLEPTAIDGTCENIIQNGKLTTKEDLLFYNINKGFIDDICCDFDKKLYFYNNKNNNSDKNGETTKLINYIEQNNTFFKNKIIIMDRLYSSYRLLAILNKYNINYIIRMKDCLELLKPNDKINSNNKNYNFIIKLKNDNDIKIVEYNIPTELRAVTKTNEVKTLKYNSNYKLITNLGKFKSYNDDIIKKLYRARWNIEVNIGKIKDNFKFETFYGSDDDFMKQKYISLINEVIVKFIILVCGSYRYNLDNKQFNNNVNKRNPNNKKIDKRKKVNKEKINDYNNEPTYKARLNINFSQAVEGYYEKILTKIINCDLDVNTLLNFNESYIEIEKYNTKRKYEIKSILPYTKWYIKMYHKKYAYEKIIEAILNNSIDSLNKNLKTKALDIKNNLKNNIT